VERDLSVVELFGEAITNKIPKKRTKDPSSADVPDSSGLQAHGGAFSRQIVEPCRDLGNDSSIIPAKDLSIMPAKAGQVTFD
jgi:hypothetical protein